CVCDETPARKLWHAVSPGADAPRQFSITARFAASKRRKYRLEHHDRHGSDRYRQRDIAPQSPAIIQVLVRSPVSFVCIRALRKAGDLMLYRCYEATKNHAGDYEQCNPPKDPASTENRQASDEGCGNSADEEPKDGRHREHAVGADDAVER